LVEQKKLLVLSDICTVITPYVFPEVKNSDTTLPFSNKKQYRCIHWAICLPVFAKMLKED
jgi:hypothetical protein